MKSAKTPNMPSALHKFKPRLVRGFFRMTVVKERPYEHHADVLHVNEHKKATFSKGRFL